MRAEDERGHLGQRPRVAGEGEQRQQREAGLPIVQAGRRALAVVTLGVAATAPALVETISQASPPDRRGAATALYGFALFVGAGLGAPAATLVRIPYPARATGFAAVVALGSLIAFLATAATSSSLTDPARWRLTGWLRDRRAPSASRRGAARTANRR